MAFSHPLPRRTVLLRTGSREVGLTTRIEPRDYWSEACLPSVAIVFLLPLVAAYEFVATASSYAGVRNAADLWMRSFLAVFGLTHGLILPLFVLTGLFIWHRVGRHPFRCRTSVCLGVIAESIAFSALLILIGQAVCLSVSHSEPPSLTTAVASFLGAGIYEEVLFRLLLLPATFAGLRLARMPVKTAWGIAIAANALLFATAHYLAPGVESFRPGDLLAAGSRVIDNPAEWLGWMFRLTAGAAFCFVFLYRGLAVAVGSHVCYDLLVGVVMEQWVSA